MNGPHTLVVTNDFPPREGGIETYVHELVKRFPPQSVTVLTSSRGPATAEERATYDRSCPYEVVRHPDPILLPTPSVTALAAAVARDVGAQSVWFGAAAPLALMARSLRRRVDLDRTVATTHGHELWWAAAPGTRQALRRIGDSVDTVTYIAEYIRRRVASALSPAAARRMVRLTPAVTPAAFATAAGTGTDAEAVRERYGIGPGPVVLCVSRLVPRKGQDRLIVGWAQVVRAHPEARLVIAGGGPYEQQLRDLAATSPAAHRITLTGRVPDADLPGLYQAASVFAMPCRSRHLGLEVEGLGIVYLEAQAAGLPVVVGDSGGAPDAVLEGETGFVVDGSGPGEAADRIIELLDDPARAARMGAAGRSWVRECWDWQTRYADLCRLLGREP
jgi:phosphatidylinositol alpha-1,6-mannosyltransferase